MDDNETVTQQPAPSPAFIHVPPGNWTLAVKDASGKVVATVARVTGPADLAIELAAK